MAKDPTDEYHFGYSREEMERIGYQHRVWVEANQRLLERAKFAGFSNIETRESNLESFDLPAGSIDMAYGRWMLMYLSEAAARRLVDRLVGWLKPGGVCALSVMDFRVPQRVADPRTTPGG